MKSAEVQSFAVKRAEVEFHNFASLGEPARAMAHYRQQNVRRGELIHKYGSFIGPLTPFLEIGSNVGHSSYMLANEFGAAGFALDISADSLRYGVALQDAWRMSRAPIRVAGDIVHLPFRDGSLRFVMAFQTLSQFMDIESVFLEVKRVLAPGGVFLLSEEPLRRVLTLGLCRCPYYDTMRGWERHLYDWGLLGFLARDVIGAYQEESFGIVQNHRLDLQGWHRLIEKHFAAHEYDISIRATGWLEGLVRWLAVRLDPYHSDWRAARLLGGTLSAFCRKAGTPSDAGFAADRFETYLRCPDCGGALERDADDLLRCAGCGYEAANEGGVYNLLPSAERRELYPGDRADIIDFSLPGHAAKLGAGWYDLEGVFGNKYRWIGPRATARIEVVNPGPQRLRIRGHAQAGLFERHQTAHIEASVNGSRVGQWTLERTGLFILECDLPAASAYQVEITAAPVWSAPGDARTLTVDLSMIRLVPGGEIPG
jgi:ubiquinone/menaquinone biosynthesis C-methylase UbiE